MEVGLYGKLPSQGDMLKRRVSDAFVSAWDEWLQQGMAASRATLGDSWREVYLTSPVWRFVCDAGVCGGHSVAGLMAPSVDRIGRYFPLTLVWEVPGGVQPFAVVQRASGWFDQVERLMVDAVREEQADFEKFDDCVVSLSRELDRVSWASSVELSIDAAAAVLSGKRAQWQIALGTPPSFSSILEQLMYAGLRITHTPLTLLWTEGSAMVEPSCLLMSGLPAPASYAALLSGRWSDEGWDVVSAKTRAAPLHADTWLAEQAIAYRSVGMSDIGRVRTANQDAFIERTEIGLWAVADGMGGHDHGDIASRMICDALAELVPGDTLQATVELITQGLARVNTYLFRAATRAVNPVHSGSTVVVFVARGTRYAVLWVGDSRVYRVRRDELVQLTRDHVPEYADALEPNHTITRAVGGDAALEVDVAYGLVQPGDRFLLCSDGLNHEVGDDVIGGNLSEKDLTACVRQLLSSALQAGGTDNISVIVVDAAKRM